MNRLTREALAGLVGSFGMHAFRILWETCAPEPEDGIFGFDREADINSAQLVSRFVSGRRMNESSASKLGLLLHYLYGPAIVVMYARTAARFSSSQKGKGLPFGVALWALGDELPISLLGISDPKRKSPASHVSAVLAHVIFGTVVVHILKSASQ